VNANVVSGDTGSTTDENGIFSITAEIDEELTVSHIGFELFTTIVASKQLTILLIPMVVKGEEIIVRGGLSGESLGQATSSITVFSSKDLKNMDGSHFQSLIDEVPNLNWAGGTSRPRYFQIRGIGERSHYFGEGPPNFSVGFVMDDIDLSGMGMAGLLYDLDQVEIFKGPQSSIYGSNALAGLISLHSTDPVDEFGANIRLTVGGDNLERFSGLINIPLSEILSARFGFESGTSDGYRTNQFLDLTNTNSRDESIIRGKVLYKPNDNLKVLYTSLNAELNNKYDAWAPDNNEDFKTYTNQQGWDRQGTDAYSVKGEYTKKKFNGTIIKSRSETDLVHSYDGDWGNDEYWLQEPYLFDPDITGWNYEFYDSTARNRINDSYEVRLKYGNFVVGYFDKNLKENDKSTGYLFGGDATSGSSQFDLEVEAVYSQLELTLFNKLKFLAKFRAETDEIKYNGNSSYYGDPFEPDSFNVNHELWGGKVVLQYETGNYSNIYTSISKGYKAGGINQHPSLLAGNIPYDPETMVNYEFGLRIHTQKTGLNLTLFKALRNDQQVLISQKKDEENPNTFIYYTANATTGKLSGLELDGSYRISDQLSFSGSMGIINSHVDPFTVQIDTSTAITLGEREAAHAPKYSFNLSFDYNDSEGLFYKVELAGKDKFYFSDSHDEISKSYQLLNGHIGYHFGDFSIKIWGRNILDERYAVRGFYFGLEPVWNEEVQDHEYPYKKFVSYGNPLQFGVTFDCKL